MNSIISSINYFTEKTGSIVSWLSIFLIGLIGLDVALRYLFNWSSSANTELEWHIFAALFLLGSAYTLRYDKHVRVDVLYTHFSDKKKAWVNMIGTAIFLFPFCIVILITSIPFVMDAWVIAEGSPEPGGLPYRFVVKSTIPLGAFLLFIQAISMMLSSISVILSPQSK